MGKLANDLKQIVGIDKLDEKLKELNDRIKLIGTRGIAYGGVSGALEAISGAAGGAATTPGSTAGDIGGNVGTAVLGGTLAPNLVGQGLTQVSSDAATQALKDSASTFQPTGGGGGGGTSPADPINSVASGDAGVKTAQDLLDGTDTGGVGAPMNYTTYSGGQVASKPEVLLRVVGVTADPEGTLPMSISTSKEALLGPDDWYTTETPVGGPTTYEEGTFWRIYTGISGANPADGNTFGEAIANYFEVTAGLLLNAYSVELNELGQYKNLGTPKAGTTLNFAGTLGEDNIVTGGSFVAPTPTPGSVSSGHYGRIDCSEISGFPVCGIITPPSPDDLWPKRGLFQVYKDANGSYKAHIKDTETTAQYTADNRSVVGYFNEGERAVKVTTGNSGETLVFELDLGTGLAKTNTNVLVYDANNILKSIESVDLLKYLAPPGF